MSPSPSFAPPFALLLSNAFVLFLTRRSFLLHFTKWSQPPVSRLALRISLLPVVYSTFFTYGWYFPNALWTCEIAMSLYEGYVVYCFFCLLVLYCGGKTGTSAYIANYQHQLALDAILQADAIHLLEGEQTLGAAMEARHPPLSSSSSSSSSSDSSSIPSIPSSKRPFRCSRPSSKCFSCLLPSLTSRLSLAVCPSSASSYLFRCRLLVLQAAFLRPILLVLSFAFARKQNSQNTSTTTTTSPNSSSSAVHERHDDDDRVFLSARTLRLLSCLPVIVALATVLHMYLILRPHVRAMSARRKFVAVKLFVLVGALQMGALELLLLLREDNGTFDETSYSSSGSSSSDSGEEAVKLYCLVACVEIAIAAPMFLASFSPASFNGGNNGSGNSSSSGSGARAHDDGDSSDRTLVVDPLALFAKDYYQRDELLLNDKHHHTDFEGLDAHLGLDESAEEEQGDLEIDARLRMNKKNDGKGGGMVACAAGGVGGKSKSARGDDDGDDDCVMVQDPRNKRVQYPCSTFLDSPCDGSTRDYDDEYRNGVWWWSSSAAGGIWCGGPREEDDAGTKTTAAFFSSCCCVKHASKVKEVLMFWRVLTTVNDLRRKRSLTDMIDCGERDAQHKKQMALAETAGCAAQREDDLEGGRYFSGRDDGDDGDDRLRDCGRLVVWKKDEFGNPCAADLSASDDEREGGDSQQGKSDGDSNSNSSSSSRSASPPSTPEEEKVWKPKTSYSSMSPAARDLPPRSGGGRDRRGKDDAGGGTMGQRPLSSSSEDSRSRGTSSSSSSSAKKKKAFLSPSPPPSGGADGGMAASSSSSGGSSRRSRTTTPGSSGGGRRLDSFESFGDEGGVAEV